MGYGVRRFGGNPLVSPALDRSIGRNLNGPSVLRVPDWVSEPLGRYYLYFGHHQGQGIRLAVADDVRGPWRVHSDGVLRLEETVCRGHIASPDVHAVAETQRIRMYFHGCTSAGQRSFDATSSDGLHFEALPEVLGPFYFRVFRYEGAWYAIAKVTDSPGGGRLLRSADGLGAFEAGPDLLPNMRHAAVRRAEDRLEIFFSRGEDCPERILVSVLSLTGDWRGWRASAPEDVLRPFTEYEGAHLPLVPSRFGAIHEPAHQVRDPAVYEEDGRCFLFYSGAGEACLCGAELVGTGPC